MPRQLKTYVATTGFFELAVAAPSMKAALEIWGAGRDLFQRGYAKETNDPAIVKATMAKPGTVLKRAVGASGVFKEKADLPDVSKWEAPDGNPVAPKAPKPSLPLKKERGAPKPIETEPPKPSAADLAAERKAARLFEAAQKKREREAARAEEVERRARESRERGIQKAEAAAQAAQDAHNRRVAAIDEDRAAVERRAGEEEERWSKEKRKSDETLRRARA